MHLKPVHPSDLNQIASMAVEIPWHKSRFRNTWMFLKIGVPPKSSILNHPFWGFPPIFGNTHITPHLKKNPCHQVIPAVTFFLSWRYVEVTFTTFDLGSCVIYTPRKKLDLPWIYQRLNIPIIEMSHVFDTLKLAEMEPIFANDIFPTKLLPPVNIPPNCSPPRLIQELLHVNRWLNVVVFSGMFL